MGGGQIWIYFCTASKVKRWPFNKTILDGPNKVCQVLARLWHWRFGKWLQVRRQIVQQSQMHFAHSMEKGKTHGKGREKGGQWIHVYDAMIHFAILHIVRRT